MLGQVGVGGLNTLPPIKNGRELPVPSPSEAAPQAQGAELPLPEGTAESFHLGWFGETSVRRLLAANSSNGAATVTTLLDHLADY